MSHPYQDPRYQPTSGHYRTSSNVPRQSEQHIPPIPTTQDPHYIHPSQHVFPGPTHLESRQHPQPSGHSGGYPYAEGHIPFPGPYPGSSPLQPASAGQLANYVAPPPPQAMSQSTVDPYERERQRPHVYHSSGGSSGSHSAYPMASSVASSSVYAHSEFQPHPGPGSGYTDMNARAQPQNLNATIYDEGPHSSDSRQKAPSNPPIPGRSSGYTDMNARARPQNLNTTVYDEGPDGSDSRQKAPSNPPITGRRPQCRYPSCYNYAFVDPRVNELREWCSDNHMLAAVQNGLEKPCKQCRVWPRRNGYHYCSGNVCRYRPPGW